MIAAWRGDEMPDYPSDSYGAERTRGRDGNRQGGPLRNPYLNLPIPTSLDPAQVLPHKAPGLAAYPRCRLDPPDSRNQAIPGGTPLAAPAPVAADAHQHLHPAL